MNSRNVLALLIGLVIAFALFAVSRLTESPPEGETVIMNLDKEAVTRIRIAAPEQVVVLERRPDGWRVTEPADFAADGPLIDSVLLTFDRLVSEGVISRNPEKAATFGVDEAQVIRVSFYREGDSDPMGTLGIGKLAPGFGSTFATIGDGHAVHQVEGSLRYQVERSPKEWRDRTIMRVVGERIQRIDFTGEDTVAVARDGETWAWADPPPGGTRPEKALDPERVKALLDFLERVKAAEFVDDAPATEGEPLLTLSIHEEGKESPTDLVVERRVAGRYQVVVDADPQRYLIAGGLLRGFVFGPVNALIGAAGASDDTLPFPEPSPDAGVEAPDFSPG